jgi:hypothetical protein
VLNYLPLAHNLNKLELHLVCGVEYANSISDDIVHAGGHSRRPG